MIKKTNKSSNKSIIRFLVITYCFSWLVWMPGILSSKHIIGSIPWKPLFAIGTCGPMVAAIYCKSQSGGWRGVKEWLSVGFSKKIPAGIWLFMIVVPFLIPAMGLSFFQAFGYSIDPLPVFESPLLVLPSFILMVTIGGGQEEYGWRGFLLEQLDETRKPWQSDLIMIGFHSFWHLPLFFISFTAQYYYPFWIFLLFGAGFTLLINQIYRRTGKSLLAAILFHGLVNTGLEIFPPVGPFVHFSYGALIINALLFVLTALVLNRFRQIQPRKFQYEPD